jgi:hypothetical protein
MATGHDRMTMRYGEHAVTGCDSPLHLRDSTGRTLREYVLPLTRIVYQSCDLNPRVVEASALAQVGIMRRH